jgi:hypothetical protein
VPFFRRGAASPQPCPGSGLLPIQSCIEAASAARGSIRPVQCVMEAGQRGIVRPQEGACDSGALEYTPRHLAVKAL